MILSRSYLRLSLLFLILLGIASKGRSQDSTKFFFDEKTKKFTLYTGGIYTLSMVGLYQLWYKDYPQSSFHLFNDNNEWLQIDKVGHAYSAYVLTDLAFEILKNGDEVGSKKEIILSGGATFLFLSTIEIFDGFSKEWGFSWGDMIANTSGVALFSAQELIFQKQFLRLKYSYQNTDFSNQRPDLLGENTLQSAFKDYNGQTYWASFNVNNFHRKVKPKWLNIAFGYGGENMLSAENSNLSNGEPYRQYYISLDVDFQKIETKNQFLKNVLKVANCFKFPLPAYEFSEKNKFHWLYF